MLGPVESAVGSKQAQVRQNALSFYEECYRWIGDSIKPAVEKLNKPQQDELDKVFTKIKESGEPKPKATRVTKKEEENKKNAEIEEICAKEEEEEKQAMEALDLAEDKDALAKFDDSWAESTLALKKWNEKKEKLEQLNNEINTPKIIPNRNLTAVCGALSKLVKDSNMNVYDEVVKAVGYLAKGLKKNFKEEAKMLTGPVITNIKKRPNIIQNVVATLDNILLACDLEDVLPLIKECMKDKNPLIVKQSAEFLQNSIKVTYIDDLTKIYSTICPDLVKLANHQDGELRDCGLATLGLLKGRLKEGMDKYMGDLNQQKLDKVSEAAAEVKLTKFDKPRVQKKAKKKEVDEDGDAIMSFDKPKPKAKAKPKASGPPASFLNRQKEMGEKAAEKFEELKAELNGGEPPKKAKPAKPVEEEKKAPPKAAPAPAARPKTAKPAGKKPKIQVEETGPGVSKEDADAIITERAPGDILKQFEDSKWQEKKEAYTRFAAWILEQEYSNELYEASFWYVKIKMKEWKEKNVNIVKAALQCLVDVIKGSECMSKRAATIIIPFLSESIGDPKYKEQCAESLMSLAELVGPGFVAKNMCKHTSNAKAPNVIIENNSCLEKILAEFGTDGMPVQDLIGVGVICCDNKNAKVRTETINMLSTLYKHLGEGIRPFLKDIKDSTLAVINAEFDKITPYSKGEFTSKREIRNEEVKAEVEEAAGEENDPLASIPRADVSKELGGQKLIALINDDNWKKRKEAIDKMNAILEKANNRILPNGLSELVGLLKVKMADSNKSVSKGFIEFVGNFATALGNAAKTYAPMLIKPLLRCLSEKNTLVRNLNIEAIDKWAAAIGPETLIGDMGKVIVKENPEIRLVLLEWILKNKESIPKCEIAELPKPLVACLQDKAPAIRTMAEQVIIEVIPFTGPSPFNKIVKDLKPAVQNSVKQIMEKCVSQADVPADQEMEDVSAKPAAKQEAPAIDKSKPAALQRAADPKNTTNQERPKTAAPMTAKKIHEKLAKKPTIGGLNASK